MALSAFITLTEIMDNIDARRSVTDDFASYDAITGAEVYVLPVGSESIIENFRRGQ